MKRVPDDKEIEEKQPKMIIGRFFEKKFEKGVPILKIEMTKKRK